MSMTRQLPRLAFVEINFSNGASGEGAVNNFLEKVVCDELLVCWVESEARREISISATTIETLLLVADEGVHYSMEDAHKTELGGDQIYSLAQ